jgi:hypothetical protein
MKNFSAERNRTAVPSSRTIMGSGNFDRSGFKTSPRARSLCWTQTVNPRNIPDIPAVGRLSPP